MSARTMTMEEANKIAQQRIAELEGQLKRKTIMSDLFSVCDEHDWANQKAGLQCPHCRIAELEAKELGYIQSLRTLAAEIERMREAITEFLDTDPYYECTEKALRKLEEAGR
jgi:hypothetical protein